MASRCSVSCSDNRSVVRKPEHIYSDSQRKACVLPARDGDCIVLPLFRSRQGTPASPESETGSSRATCFEGNHAVHLCSGNSPSFSGANIREAALPNSDGTDASGPTLIWSIPDCDRESGKRRFRIRDQLQPQAMTWLTPNNLRVGIEPIPATLSSDEFSPQSDNWRRHNPRAEQCPIFTM